MISVVVPVYKVEPYLEKCINSVICQTFKDWELVLVDDGSPDNCGEICDKFAGVDPRITVIHQKNAGLSAARNAGMKVIRGDYVTFVDSDDYLEPNHLSLLYDALKANNTDISVTGYQKVNEKGEPLPNGASEFSFGVSTGKEACARLLSNVETFMISAWGKLYSRKLFDLIHYPEGRLFEDEYVTYKLLYEADTVAFTGENTYDYLIRGDSITGRSGLKNLNDMESFYEAVSYFIEKNDTQMMALAKKRLLRELRFFYLNSDGLSKADRKQLHGQWVEAYRKYHKDISENLTFAERMANCLFLGFPGVYKILSNT